MEETGSKNPSLVSFSVPFCPFYKIICCHPSLHSFITLSDLNDMLSANDDSIDKGITNLWQDSMKVRFLICVLQVSVLFLEYLHEEVAALEWIPVYL